MRTQSFAPLRLALMRWPIFSAEYLASFPSSAFHAAWSAAGCLQGKAIIKIFAAEFSAQMIVVLFGDVPSGELPKEASEL